MLPLSYEIPIIFVEISNEKDTEKSIKQGLKFVEECFERFPKEKDSITHCILESLISSAESEKQKIYFEFLQLHLSILYSNYSNE